MLSLQALLTDGVLGKKRSLLALLIFKPEVVVCIASLSN